MADNTPTLVSGRTSASKRAQFVATGFAIAAAAMMIAGALAMYMARRHASGIHPGSEWLNGLKGS